MIIIIVYILELAKLKRKYAYRKLMRDFQYDDNSNEYHLRYISNLNVHEIVLDLYSFY